MRGSDTWGVRQVGQSSDIANHLIIQLKWKACPQDNLFVLQEFVLGTGSIQIEQVCLRCRTQYPSIRTEYLHPSLWQVLIYNSQYIFVDILTGLRSIYHILGTGDVIEHGMILVIK